MHFIARKIYAIFGQLYQFSKELRKLAKRRFIINLLKASYEMKIEVRLTWGPSNQRIGLKKIQLCLKLF